MLIHLKIEYLPWLSIRSVRFPSSLNKTSQTLLLSGSSYRPLERGTVTRCCNMPNLKGTWLSAPSTPPTPFSTSNPWSPVPRTKAWSLTPRRIGLLAAGAIACFVLYYSTCSRWDYGVCSSLTFVTQNRD